MSPEAKMRMDVYQEGQRAFNQRGVCPYTDWRAGTWAKGFLAAKEYNDRLNELYIEQPAPDVCLCCGRVL